MSHSEFLLDVALALAGCQAVELELKVYLEQARLMNRQIKLRDMSEMPLGRLIREFHKVSKHSGLKIRLDQFRKKRNYVVHSAISACLNEDGSVDDYRIAASHLDLYTVQRDARELIDDIGAEHSKLFKIVHNIPIPRDDD